MDKHIIADLVASDLGPFVIESKACKNTGDSYELEGKHGSLILNFESFSFDSCIIKIRRIGGNGLISINDISTNISSKVLQNVEVYCSSKITIIRPDKSDGNVQVVGVTLYSSIDMHGNWSAIISKCSEYKSIRLVGGNLLAAEGASLKAGKITKIITSPEGAYKVFGEGHIEFPIACRIVELEIEPEEGRLISPFSTISSDLHKNIEPIQNTKQIIAPFRLHYDSGCAFSKEFCNRDATLGASHVKLEYQGEYSIPLRDAISGNSYTVSIELLRLNGNGRYLIDIIPENESLNKFNNDRIKVAPDTKKTETFVLVAGSGGSFKLVVGRHDTARGAIVISRVAVAEHGKGALDLYVSSNKINAHEWLLTKIPKIAHFYWGGNRMPYLRYISILSFRRHNPKWHIKLHMPEAIGTVNPTWQTKEQFTAPNIQDTCVDYFDRISDLNIEIVKHDFSKYGFSNDVNEVHKSDFLRWILLSTDGGLWSDNDIIYTAPMTEMKDNIGANTEKDTCLCVYENAAIGGGHAIGFLLASQNNEFFAKLSNEARKAFKPGQYQCIGAQLLNSKFDSISATTKCNCLMMDPETVYPETRPKQLLSPGNFREYKDAIGFHLYGGSPEIAPAELHLNETNYKAENTILSSLITDAVNVRNFSNKKYKAVVLIASYKRANLLKWGLASLARQNIVDDVQIVVINDGIPDETEEVCDRFSNVLNIKYIFTGQRNLDAPKWRCPSFAINIGAQQTDSEFIFISCAEMFHLDNTVSSMLAVLQNNPKLLTIPGAKDDNGSFLSCLEENGSFTGHDYNKQPPLLNVKFPFFMGMNRSDFVSIGGYDEDFIGVGWDDNDIVERMQAVGNRYQPVNARVVHLYHQRLCYSAPDMIAGAALNERIYKSRKGQPYRNKGRKWGVL